MWVLIGGVENNLCVLDIYQCTCGFKMGLDAIHLDHTEDITITCPVCDEVLNTATVLGEDDYVVVKLSQYRSYAKKAERINLNKSGMSKPMEKILKDAETLIVEKYPEQNEVKVLSGWKEQMVFLGSLRKSA